MNDHMKTGLRLKETHKSNSMQHAQDCCCSWLSDFNQALRQLTGYTNYQRFKQLLIIYAK
jgi:hypothetical protein